jgi:hypothetical protein
MAQAAIVRQVTAAMATAAGVTGSAVCRSALRRFAPYPNTAAASSMRARASAVTKVLLLDSPPRIARTPLASRASAVRVHASAVRSA